MDFNNQVEKCKIYKNSLSKNRWVIKNKEKITEGDIISVSYFPNSQRNYHEYIPLIGIVLRIFVENNIRSIIIRDQNNNEINIINGYHGVLNCQMLIKVFTDIPDMPDNEIEEIKKRINLNTFDESKSLKVENSDDSDFYLVSDSDS